MDSKELLEKINEEVNKSIGQCIKDCASRIDDVVDEEFTTTMDLLHDTIYDEVVDFLLKDEPDPEKRKDTYYRAEEVMEKVIQDYSFMLDAWKEAIIKCIVEGVQNEQSQE